MDKIYSRHKVPRIVKIGGLSNRNKLLLTIIIVVIIAVITAKNIIAVINPFLESQSKAIAKAETIKLANEAVSKAMENMTYNDLCGIQKDNERKYKNDEFKCNKC